MKNHFQFDKRIESVYRANAQGSNRKYVGLLFLRCKESDRGLNWDIRKKKKFNYSISTFPDELGINKDRYKSLADEMDSTFAELAGY